MRGLFQLFWIRHQPRCTVVQMLFARRSSAGRSQFRGGLNSSKNPGDEVEGAFTFYATDSGPSLQELSYIYESSSKVLTTILIRTNGFSSKLC